MISDFSHVNWFKNTGQKLTTLDKKEIALWEFRYEYDDAVMSSWARHFRNHYCPDDQIDFFRKGYGYSRAEYLNAIKFPHPTEGFGPGIRAGDFGEVLVADYLEYVLKFWVPRTRYGDKTIRNESTKGCDIIGFRITGLDDPKKDMLFIFEAKTQFSAPNAKDKSKSRLHDAVKDSSKDVSRKAESLNAIKQRLAYQGKLDEANRIDRFQSPEDRPYREIYGAVALFSTAFFDPTITAGFEAKDHPASENLALLVIHGADMMELVGKLYERAANEA